MEFHPGDVVGDYTIEGFLGAGGMGAVYKAAHPTLPRSDALKILSAQHSLDDQFRERFLREANLAATLDHPNIVSVFNRGTTEAGRLWIAMQYVPGTDADAEIRAGTMTAPRSAAIITEVAKALDFAHRRGILHRDVKPANFLIAPPEHANEDERVFLADFGIARALDDATHLTTDGNVMASVAYAAPEVLTGMEVDHRSDIYSLGCSLFRLLTSKTPYAGRQNVAMATAHVTEDPPRVTDLVPGLPRALDDVIAKAMAKEPAARYQSARELAEAATTAIADATTAIPRSTATAAWEVSPPTNPARAGGAGRPPGPLPPVAQGTGSGPTPAPYPSTYFSGPHHAPTQPRYPGLQQGGEYRAAAPPSLLRPPRPSAKKRVVIGAAALLVVAVVAVVATVLISGPPTKSNYAAQTLNHVHGSTQLTVAPTAVAVLGPGDADALLALDMQPVAIAAPSSGLPSWLRDKVTGSPTVMNFVDTNAISAAKPDLIIDTGDVDDVTYDKLKAIAPTVTKPAESDQVWNWQAQLKWIGKIVGRSSQADQVVSTVAAQQNDLKNQNPKAVGKTVSVLNVGDSGITQTLSPSNASDYLGSLGLVYSPKLSRQSSDAELTRAVTDNDRLYLIDSEVLIVLRTDKAAGNGGAAGLPPQLQAYRGVMVIVDDPDTIAALAQPGGALATNYLDSKWVPLLVSAIP